MALYAFDGTWNSGKDNEDPKYTNTNVFRFFQGYRRRSSTNDFYVAGVGTRFEVPGHILGGVFGLGALSRITEAYDHLCQVWNDGDHIIDIVGFSRGAATTLDFCHVLQQKGIRRPGTDQVIEPNPVIRFLGVWDVVAAFGLANLGNTELNIGHHLTLPKSLLQYCFHGMALDERRPSFLPTRLPGACEVWFRGAHSDIGGGNENRGLNDIALKWMFCKAKSASLPIADEDISTLQPNPATLPHIDPKLPLQVRLISAIDRCHYTVSKLDGFTNPPSTCGVETAVDEQTAMQIGSTGIEVMPLDVRRRIALLWETADAVAKAADFNLDQIHDLLLTLLQGRIVLVTNDAELAKARDAVRLLMNTAIEGARQRGFHVLGEFFFNEALFKLPRLYPLTD